MKLVISIAIVAAFAVASSPASAVAPQAKAYGKYCQNQSKKKAEGQTKSAFAQCVTAMAKAAKSESTSPREACAGMSKKRVEGQKQTPFSKCVSAAAKLKRDQQQESGS